MMAGEHGNPKSDPKKIADVLVKLSNVKDVPRRLILGKDAEAYVKRGETARAEEAASGVRRAHRPAASQSAAGRGANRRSAF